jgi:hypothetical protein
MGKRRRGRNERQKLILPEYTMGGSGGFGLPKRNGKTLPERLGRMMHRSAMLRRCVRRIEHWLEIALMFLGSARELS